MLPKETEGSSQPLILQKVGETSPGNPDLLLGHVTIRSREPPMFEQGFTLQSGRHQGADLSKKSLVSRLR